MAAEAYTATTGRRLTQYRAASTVIGRFVAKGAARSASILGFYFSVFAIASAWAFATTYKTAASRATLVASFGSNAGLNALFGKARGLDTVGGFTEWRSLMIVSIIGAIWGMAVATKRFRGEETDGRTELFLAGQTTPRQAAANILAGLAAGALIIFVFVSAATMIVGGMKEVGFTAGESIFYGLANTLAVLEFLAVGALASQIAPTRRRAVGISAAVFGIFYLMRGVGDSVASLHWLVNASPIGWIEKLRPLTDPNPIWLLPIAGFIAAAAAAALYLAGTRDMGASILPDKDTAPPRTRFLNTSFGLAWRQVRSSAAAWLLSIAGLAVIYGLISKSAAEALAASPSYQKYLGDVVQAKTLGTKAYLGTIFLVFMTIIMALAAVWVASMRNDEAEGYVDNLLVRPLSRMRWLCDRAFYIVCAVLLAGVVSGVFTWVGAAAQNTGVGFGDLMLAGLNATLPAFFVAGVGLLFYGLKPRWTAIVMYAVIGWAFLVELAGPAIHLNHWVMDTSIVHHVALSPAVDPRWGSAVIILGIALACAAVGAALFNRRDLASK